MLLQKLSESGAGARDARHDSADGDVEDDSDVLVLDLFHVAEKESFAELRGKLLKRGVQGGLIVESDKVVFRGGARGGRGEGVGVVFEEDGAGGGDAGARGEEGVAEDAEDPCLEVGAGLEGVEGTEGFGEGLLDEILGFGLIAGEPEGVVVERGEERERELFKVCAASGGGRHDAECLGRSGFPGCKGEEVRRHGEVRKELSVEHPYH